MSTIKHCPFCGSERVGIGQSATSTSQFYFVVCDTCEAEGPSEHESVKAVEKWNTRHSEPRDPERSYDGAPDYWCASSPERKPY